MAAWALTYPAALQPARLLPPGPPRPAQPGAAPPPPRSAARRSGQVEPGSGRAGAAAAAAPPRLGPAHSLARPWRARSSSGRGGRTTETRPRRRRRRPCRTRSWPWLASTCCSTTASGSRTSFSNNTGDRRALLPRPGHAPLRAGSRAAICRGPQKPPPPPVGH